MKALGKKKIIIIAGVSAAVLVTALGVGLGVGLSSDSSRTPSALDDVSFGDPILKQIRKGKDLLINGINYNDQRYSVVEEDGKLYTVIPKGTKLETKPTVFFDEINDRWNYSITYVGGSGNDVHFTGKNHFYTFTYANIGQVWIPNDGYIWGGYKYDGDAEKMVLQEALKDTGPLKFGTISESGLALIDLAVVYEYQLALAEYNEADSDGSRTSAAERIRNADSDVGKEARDNRELTWKIYNSVHKAKIAIKKNARNIADISFNPESNGISNVNVNISVTDSTGFGVSLSVDNNGLFNVTNLKCGTDPNVHGFKLKYFVNDNGEDICIIPAVNENGKARINQEVNVPLGSINLPLLHFSGSVIDHPLLSGISVSPNGFVNLPGMDPLRMPEASSSFILPNDVKIEIAKDQVLNLGTYATITNKRAEDELLISVKEEWLDYFKETAYLEEIKQLASSLGITIRFKIKQLEDDFLFAQVGRGRLDNLPEVFFGITSQTGDLTNNANDHYFKDFQYDLKENLNDINRFSNEWTDKSSFRLVDETKDLKYYPFQEETQFIAYNTDYLPSGLDFSSNNENLHDHLIQTDLGDLESVSETVSTTNDDYKTKLLAARDVNISSPIWATNHYDTLQVDQRNSFQQDIIWPNNSGYLGYYTIFKDSSIKDDPKFQSWVDHYKNGNSDLRGDNSIEYTKKALFNGHIGAIIVDSSWINNEWKSGKFRTSGTDEEKKEFAKQNLRFQALPSSAKALGTKWYATLTLELSDKKQQVAEKFISKLSSPDRVVDFNNNILNKMPNKVITYNDIEDPATKSQVKAKVNTKTASIHVVGNTSTLADAWNSVTASIDSNSTYQGILNAFVSKINASPFVQSLYVPREQTQS